MVVVKGEIEHSFGYELPLRISPPEFGVDDTEQGWIDLVIMYSFREDQYFRIECKRLSGQRKGQLDRHYVIEGMMRVDFVVGCRVDVVVEPY